jgi:hypothetical protein
VRRWIGEILHLDWRNTSLGLEKYFTWIGEILHLDWRNTSLGLEKYRYKPASKILKSRYLKVLKV